ncbi:DUF2141 domain-containing protein [Tropicimonas marinistellae]|uniref:DUF2141 domain-containing protein n=1 Tax=Tropicimonas marinistellae TaxID=1739787 RepID=UPI000830C1C3|nr:DUF2141 domain-containing protein [Tropicimonas marinistellae]
MLRAIILAAILAGTTSEGSAADLEISVTGAVPAVGEILLSVFDTADNWMRSPVASRTIEVTSAGTAKVRLAVPPGRYGIAIIHDANGNGVLDTGPLRIPREAFAFSNRAQARFGPPLFERAAFTLPPEGAAVRIPLTTAN